jgi:hypothetical protein
MMAEREEETEFFGMYAKPGEVEVEELGEEIIKTFREFPTVLNIWFHHDHSNKIVLHYLDEHGEPRRTLVDVDVLWIYGKISEMEHRRKATNIDTHPGHKCRLGENIKGEVYLLCTPEERGKGE